MKTRTRLFLVFLLFSALIFLLSAIGFLQLLLRPRLPEKMVLTVDCRGPIPEAAETSPIARLLGPEVRTVRELELVLRTAAGDPSVVGCLVKINPMLTGWARTREIREALLAFRQSGKPLRAFLEMGQNREIYLASAADNVTMAPAGYLLLGFPAQQAYFARMLETLHIKPEFERVGEYKTAVETLTRKTMSQEEREQLEALLDGILESYLREVTASRHLPAEEMWAALDRSFLSASYAMEAGLIDRTGYADEVFSEITAGDPASKSVSADRYWNHKKLEIDPPFGDATIAIVYAEGMIYSGESESGVFGPDGVGSDTLCRYLRSIREDDTIGAAVLRVNSPGGSGLASDMIWREIERIKEEGKPVIGSLGDVAASGGYYIAMGCDHIVAQPITITGSIGVFAGKFNLGDLHDWIGLDVETLRRGQNADMFSSDSGFTPEQREILRDGIEDFYDRFVGNAAAGRNRDATAIHEVARGRIWTGSQAMAVGLVDELGGLTRAVEVAKTRLNLPPDSKVRILTYPKQRGLIGVLAGKGAEAAWNGAPATIRDGLAIAEKCTRLSRDPIWALWLPGLFAEFR